MSNFDESRNPVDMILDEECTDNIVLYDDDGEAMEFEQIALVPINDDVYVILRPLGVIDGVGEDEALVFEIIEDEDDRYIEIVDDDEICETVFEEYYDMLRAEGIDVNFDD